MREGPRPEAVGLSELVRLRWASLATQLALVLGVRFALDVPVPLEAALAIVGIGAASNLALVAARARVTSPDRLVGPVLLLDSVLLTALLYVSGGASNPFSVLYLVHVTLAAVTATRRWAFIVVCASVLGYAALFLAPELAGMSHPHAGSEHAHHHHGGAAPEADTFSAHLYGMWIAFGLTAALVGWFVSGVAQRLGEERERAARSARLVALSTLAAGAAHEILTPLGTIKVAAGEIERALSARDDMASVLDDVRLVKAEVERSRAVLERLRGEAGELAGEPVEPMTLATLETELRSALGASGERVELRCDVPGRDVRAPRRALTFALASLVRNAIDASRDEDRVEVVLGTETRGIVVSVRDRGRGMSREELARAGEPFFTTKEPGRGMGLGLFIARSLVEQLGGELELRSRSGEGTTAVVHLPHVSARSTS